MSRMSVPRPSAPQPTVTSALLVTLALLAALAPFATDLYLPTFPQMTGELHASATTVQLTLTAYLLGTAAGQLAFGPLSDRFGRTRPLILGMALCILASAGAALASTVGVLIVARVAQGFTGASGMVIGRAIIADRATGATAARAFNLITLVMAVAPVIAPVAGGLLADPLGWRGIFWVVAAIVACMLVLVLAVVRDTAPLRLTPAHESPSQRPSGLLSRAFIGYTVAFVCGFAVLMAYIAASPFVLQTMIGMTSTVYGLVFGINAAAFVAVTAIAARLARSHSVTRLLGIGLAAAFISGALVFVIAISGLPDWLLLIPFLTADASLGLVLGNATALAIGAAGNASGAGSAIMGAAQFTLAAVVTPLVGIAGPHSAVAVGITMTVLGALALAGYIAARTSPPQRPRSTPITLRPDRARNHDLTSHGAASSLSVKDCTPCRKDPT